jgi:hypothetical protein
LQMAQEPATRSPRISLHWLQLHVLGCSISIVFLPQRRLHRFAPLLRLSCNAVMLADTEIMAVLPAAITLIGLFLHGPRSPGNRRLRDTLDAPAGVDTMRRYDPVHRYENPLLSFFPLAHFSLPKHKRPAFTGSTAPFLRSQMAKNWGLAKPLLS